MLGRGLGLGGPGGGAALLRVLAAAPGRDGAAALGAGGLAPASRVTDGLGRGQGPPAGRTVGYGGGFSGEGRATAQPPAFKHCDQSLTDPL